MKFNNALIKAGLVCLYVSFNCVIFAQSYEKTNENIRKLNRKVMPVLSPLPEITGESSYITDDISGEIIGEYLGDIDGYPMRIYPLSEDLGISNNTKPLNEGEELGYNLEGSNMTFILNDVGTPRGDHLLFKAVNGESRISPSNKSIKFHATHMASIMCANDSLGSTYKGMASKAKIELIENYGQEQYAESLVSNHSVIRAGGTYHYFFDGNTFNHPYHTEVTASGNDGPFAYTLKNNSKNEITVGNVEDIVAYNSPKDVKIVNTSSAGPTIDGRIKPDLVANGKSVLAAAHSSPSAVANGAGTSQACAGTSGSLILVQEYYHNQYDTYMKSATLKALSVHTARESGSSPGPDYYFGYGVLNTLEMVKVIEADSLQTQIHELDLANDEVYTMDIFPNYNEPLIVTLAWTDPSSGQIIAPFSGNAIDTSLRALVNDLDIKIIVEDKTYLPYTLDRMNPCEPAINSDNAFDNLEMIEIPRPINSDLGYTIEISHKGNLVNDHQYFSLVLSGTASAQENTIKQAIKIEQNDEINWVVDKELQADIIISGKLNIQGNLAAIGEDKTISVLENGELTLSSSELSNVDVYLFPNSKLILNGISFLNDANFYLLDSVEVENFDSGGLYVMSDSTFVYDYMDNINLTGLVVPDSNLVESNFPGILPEMICIFDDQLIDTTYNLMANKVLLGFPSENYSQGLAINADVVINTAYPLVACQNLKIKKNKSFRGNVISIVNPNPIIVPGVELLPIVHKYYNGIKYLSNPCQYVPINVYD